MDAIFKVGFSDDVPSAPIPDVLNLDYWFSEDVTRRLIFSAGSYQRGRR